MTPRHKLTHILAQTYKHKRPYRSDSQVKPKERNKPSLMDDPNAFIYQSIGYANMDDHGVHYVSTCGGTSVRADVQDLRLDDGVERRHRIKVERVGFWATVHSVTTTTAAAKQVSCDTELTVGLVDGTVIAVTRQPATNGGGFNVFIRNADGSETDEQSALKWPDGRPVLESRMDGSAITVTASDGTRLYAHYNDDDHGDSGGGGVRSWTVCKVHVSDGTWIRTRTGPGAVLQYYRASDADGLATAGAHDKYLVCRRDMSGYEFVHDSNDGADEPMPYRGGARPTNVVRTLTRSHFTDRTDALLDRSLTDHLKTIEALAQRLNATIPRDVVPKVSMDVTNNAYTSGENSTTTIDVHPASLTG